MLPLTLPPGVVSVPTDTTESLNWVETSLMRWINDRITPVGGWETAGYSDTASDIRAMHTWVTNAGQQMTAYLCEGHCYVDKGDGILQDISPTPAIVPPTNTLVTGGFGDNNYSYDTYGTPRPARELLKPVAAGYYIDNWGEDLVFMTSSDGRLLRWKPSVPATAASAVPNAPVGNRAFAVMPQRHVILFGGAGFINRTAWCSQEDIENWDYADITKTAGFLEFQPNSIIITCCKSGDEVLFWTARGDMFTMRYIGTPYIYSQERVMNGGVPFSPMSCVDTPVGAVWMTMNGPWRYEAGSASPVQCPVWDWMQSDYIESYTRIHAAMVPLTMHSEIWWFFPDANSQRNTKYLQWNYKDGWWGMGKLGRACGASSTYTTAPLMADKRKVYRHESGSFYSGLDENTLPYAQTHNFNTDGGDRLTTIISLLPDLEGVYGALTFELDYNIPRVPGLANTGKNSGRKSVKDNGFVYFTEPPVTGRDFRLKLRQAGEGIGPWTMGNTRIGMIGRGGQ